MGLFLSLLLYAAYTLLLGRIAWRIYLIGRKQSTAEFPDVTKKTRGVLTAPGTVFDILFFSRLFRNNPCLWLWEWLFHATFGLVLIRHLRYIMLSPPAWLTSFQTLGVCSGYMLTASLLLIFLYKLTSESVRYVSSYNFLILFLILLISVTGILMRTLFRADLISVKRFLLGALTFSPASAPDSGFFLIHFMASLILLVFIPSHIFTAPWSLLEARRRDEELKMVMHGK